MGEITSYFAAARSGDAQAQDKVFRLLYDDLSRLARSRLHQNQPMTLLDTGSLVHEAFLKICGSDAIQIQDRQHFFAYAAHVMRSVIVDFARARLAQRRGGDLQRVPIDTVLSDSLAAPEGDVMRIHEALEELALVDPRMVQVVEMRYFVGLSDAEIAQALDLSERTIGRAWEKAKLLLAETLRK